MPFIPVANVVQCETVFLRDGQYCENVYNVSGAGGYTAGDIRTLLQLFISWWNVNLKALVPVNISLVNTIGTDLTTQNGLRVEESTGLPLTGTEAGSPYPNNVALAIKWLTNSRGRSFRGRTYHVGLSSNNVSQNTVTGAHANALEAAYGQLITDLAAASYTLVVVSRYTNNMPRSNGVATPITGLSVNTTVDSQRRRLPGRGL